MPVLHPNDSAKVVVSQAASASPVTPATYTTGSRLAGVNGLRFIAAIWVVIYHFGLPSPAGSSFPLSRLVFGAPICLGMFFLLSGFVLGFSYGDRPLSKRKFYVARLARVTPLFLFALLLSLPSFLLQTTRIGVSHTILAIILTPLMLQSLVPSIAMAWNYPGWSVSVEVFFYLLFPSACSCFAGRKLRTCVLWITAFTVISLAPPVAYCWFNPDGLRNFANVVNGGFGDITNSRLDVNGWLGFLKHSPLFHLGEFLAGVALSRTYRMTAPALRGGPGNLLFWSAAAGLLVVAFFAKGLPFPLLHNGLALPLLIALLLGTASGNNVGISLLDSRLFDTLGNASYAVYILQYPVFVVAKASYLFTTRGHATAGNAISSPWFFPCYLLLLLVVSLAVTRWFEPRWVAKTKQLLSAFSDPHLPFQKVTAPLDSQRLKVTP